MKKIYLFTGKELAQLKKVIPNVRGKRLKVNGKCGFLLCDDKETAPYGPFHGSHLYKVPTNEIYEPTDEELIKKRKVKK